MNEAAEPSAPGPFLAAAAAGSCPDHDRCGQADAGAGRDLGGTVRAAVHAGLRCTTQSRISIKYPGRAGLPDAPRMGSDPPARTVRRERICR